MAHHSPFSLCLLLLSLLAVATYSDYFILTSVHTCLSRSSGVHCPATLPANQGRWKIDAAEGPGRGPAVLCRITQYRNTGKVSGVWVSGVTPVGRPWDAHRTPNLQTHLVPPVLEKSRPHSKFTAPLRYKTPVKLSQLVLQGLTAPFARA